LLKIIDRPFRTAEVGLAASPLPAATSEDLSQALATELRALERTDVEASELDFARRRLKANLARAQETRSGLAEQMAFSEAYLGGAGAALARFAQYDELSAADVRRAAALTFGAQRRVTGWLHPPPLSDDGDLRAAGEHPDRADRRRATRARHPPAATGAGGLVAAARSGATGVTRLSTGRTAGRRASARPARTDAQPRPRRRSRLAA
jgi:hypothetical protein